MDGKASETRARDVSKAPVSREARIVEEKKSELLVFLFFKTVVLARQARGQTDSIQTRRQDGRRDDDMTQWDFMGLVTENEIPIEDCTQFSVLTLRRKRKKRKPTHSDQTQWITRSQLQNRRSLSPTLFLRMDPPTTTTTTTTTTRINHPFRLAIHDSTVRNATR